MCKYLSTYILFIFLVTVSQALFAEGLKSADWSVNREPKIQKSVERSPEPINLSLQNRAPQSIGALIRQSVVSLQFRLENVKSALKAGKNLSKNDQDFLKEVAKHQTLSQYMDSELWASIRERGDKGEKWADEIITLSGRGLTDAALQKTETNKVQEKDSSLNEAGMELVDQKEKKRFVSKNNGITRSILTGYQGPDYAPGTLPAGSNADPANDTAFTNDGFNYEQRKFKRKLVLDEKKKEYEKKIFGRELVMDEEGSSSSNVAMQNDIDTNIRNSPTSSQSGNSSNEQFDPSSMISKIMEGITADLPKGEKMDIETSVAAALESSQAAADQVSSAAAANNNGDGANRKEGEEKGARVTASTGQAGAHR